MSGIIESVMQDVGSNGRAASGLAGFGWIPNTEQKPGEIARTDDVPPDAMICTASDGMNFFAPSKANWNAVHDAGQAGGIDPMAASAAISHYGNFDFQRDKSKNIFMSAYTDASNYAVGVYMHGAGFSLPETKVIGYLYGKAEMSKNAGQPSQTDWWTRGWNAANAQDLSGVCQ
ncbi:MAG: hypothetical protein ACHP7O_05685 [Burkholderiales bacterium]